MDRNPLSYHLRPRLEAPGMVLGFSGWLNGGEVSTGIVDYLLEATDADIFAELDPRDFYIYNFPGSMEMSALFRPYARIEEGLVSAFHLPNNAFYFSESFNLILFQGKEPNLQWEEFASYVLDVAEENDVSRIFFVGSVTNFVPHTREPIFYSSTSDEAMRDLMMENGLNPTNYEGPASFLTYMVTQARERGLQMATIVAGIPPYVEGKNMKCIESAARKLAAMMDLPLDFAPLAAQSRDFLDGLNAMINRRRDLAEQIRKLETEYDKAMGVTDDKDTRNWFERQDI